MNQKKNEKQIAQIGEIVSITANGKVVDITTDLFTKKLFYKISFEFENGYAIVPANFMVPSPKPEDFESAEYPGYDDPALEG